jgi:hypothetical protein
VAGFVGRRHGGELSSRWTNDLADRWEREAPAWAEPERDTLDLLSGLSPYPSLRLGLLGDDRAAV